MIVILGEIERIMPWEDLIQDGEEAKITGNKNGYLEMVRNKMMPPKIHKCY